MMQLPATLYHWNFAPPTPQKRPCARLRDRGKGAILAPTNLARTVSDASLLERDAYVRCAPGSAAADQKESGMSEVFRVCPNCGEDVAMAARHCSECGYNTQDGYPLERRNNLPAMVARVGLPVAAGLTGLVLRAGWQLPAETAADAGSQRAQPERVAAPHRTGQPFHPYPLEMGSRRSKRCVADRRGRAHHRDR